MKANRDWLWDG